MSEELYKTESGTLFFDGKKCIHSRNCVLNRPDVFVPNVAGEWIHPERANSAELHELANNCPSGAIRFEETDKVVTQPLVNVLWVRENGPYALKADFSIDGVASLSKQATLCRCGYSKNKPYCDGSHSDEGFIATGEVSLVESDPLDSRNGVITVTPLKDGPLAITGNLEICAGTGHTVNRIQKTHLCRCGSSKNKPYCDGSHKAAGFSSD